MLQIAIPARLHIVTRIFILDVTLEYIWFSAC